MMNGLWIVEVLLAAFVYVPYDIQGTLIQTSRAGHDLHLTEGDNVTMNCSTTNNVSTAWEYISFHLDKPVFIYINGHIVDSHRHRFSVHVDNKHKHYHLKIKNLQVSDSGMYTCIDWNAKGPDRSVTTLHVAKKGGFLTTSSINDTSAKTTESSSTANQNLPFVIVLVSLIGVLVLPVIVAGFIFRRKLGCKSKERPSETTPPPNRVNSENQQISLISSEKTENKNKLLPEV